MGKRHPIPRHTLTQKCPAPGCNHRIPSTQFACKDHWFSLPTDIRNAINRSYRARRRATSAHRAGAAARHRAAMNEGLQYLLDKYGALAE